MSKATKTTNKPIPKTVVDVKCFSFVLITILWVTNPRTHIQQKVYMVRHDLNFQNGDSLIDMTKIVNKAIEIFKPNLKWIMIWFFRIYIVLI